MTLPLRKKRPTTVPAPSRRTRTTVKLALASWLGLFGAASAQEPTLFPAPLRVPPGKDVAAASRQTLLAPPVALNAPVAASGRNTLLSPLPPSAPSSGRTLFFSKPAESLGQAGRQANPNAVKSAAFQPPPKTGDKPADKTDTPTVAPVAPPPGSGTPPSQFAPPGFEQVFGKLDSEEALEERLRQEDKQDQFNPNGGRGGAGQNDKALFPPKPTLAQVAFTGRQYGQTTLHVEPSYVCYQRLYFEQKNFERGGWDLGPITPAVCAGVFLWDCWRLPYNLGTRLGQRYECSAGECLPGSPTPFLLYPPELSVTGGLLKAGTSVGLYALFP